jgi:bifunctional DNase/RNase
MEKIRLEIIGMSYSQSQSGAYALILGEKNGKRRLPIIIGGFEAQAIAIELEKIKTPRPLTHDLFKSFAESFNIEVREILINKFQEGVFYAQLVCTDGTREEVVDSRTSDAIALALRFSCPIYTSEDIMKAASILVDEETDTPAAVNPGSPPATQVKHEYTGQSVTELKELLQKAIENEDYEKASQIRDELNRRSKTKK